MTPRQLSLLTLTNHIFAVSLFALICLLVYAVGQQILRQSAYDPQIQISEDLARRADSSELAAKLAGSEVVPIDKSLAPFVIVYDNQGKVLASSASLAGRVPVLPQGVLEYTRMHGQDRLTWEPQSGVRIAAVVTAQGTAATSGFVLAGRNMRETEVRTVKILFICAAAFVLGCAGMILSKLLKIFINIRS